MKKLAVICLVSVFSCVLLLAHGDEKTGVLMDSKCGAQLAAQSSKAAEHKVSCAMDCKDSGFGIIADGKFFRFDDCPATADDLASWSWERATNSDDPKYPSPDFLDLQVAELNPIAMMLQYDGTTVR
jgi:hypothetical protein